MPARNGAETCACDGKLLHSKYDPQTEAGRFADSLRADFSPACVAVVGPALSYCAGPLRRRFPNARLVAIRLCGGFKKTDSLWDRAIPADERLPDALFDALGEETLCATLFADWPPARNALADEQGAAWAAIRDAVNKARSVLATREHFSARWLTNAAKFASSVGRTARISVRDRRTPVVVAASGPSLAPLLPTLARERGRFFLVAVSSALPPLARAKIAPDIALSTDGGWWAKAHLSRLPEGIPLAIPPEAAVPARLFGGSVVPLCYDDGAEFERRLLERLGIKALAARRNGTVSGTALELALSLTDGDVFLAGLDQEGAEGHQHAQPNALEQMNSAGDTRLATAETRTTASRFGSEGALAIYRGWFASRPGSVTRRTFRLTGGRTFRNRLGGIRDVGEDEFLARTAGRTNGILIEPAGEVPSDGRRAKIEDEISRAFRDGRFVAEAFPALSVLQRRGTDKAGLERIRMEIERKSGELKARMLRAAGRCR